MNIIRLDKNGNSARVTVHNGVAYFTGHVSREPYPTLKEQTAAVLARYDELFALFGMKKENILMLNAYFQDISKVSEFFEVYDQWIEGVYPAGLTVEAPCITPSKLVEICFIVAVDEESVQRMKEMVESAS